MKGNLFVRKISLQSDEYVCIKCHNIFKSKAAFDDHIVKEHPELTSSDVVRHTKKHNVKQRPCGHCEKTFKTKKALDDHIIKNHEEFISSISHKIHKCGYCSFKTAVQVHLASHMSKHPESGCAVKRKRQQLQCIHCNKTFQGKKALDDHIIRKHEEFIASVSYKIRQCEHCSYKTAMSSHFVRHMKRHTKVEPDVKQITCSYCDKRFKSKQTLDDHIIKKHKEFIASISSKLHQCTYCNYKTTKPSCLADHITSKHPETGFSREVKRGERNVKQFPCVHCDSMFKSKRALDGHVFKNHKEFITSVTNKIHECQRCSYTTINRDNLATHRLKYHDAVKVVQKDL
nr:unnamed protein product [Callosobruchus analis]